jgi:hypothetical protein
MNSSDDRSESDQSSMRPADFSLASWIEERADLAGNDGGEGGGIEGRGSGAMGGTDPCGDTNSPGGKDPWVSRGNDPGRREAGGGAVEARS